MSQYDHKVRTWTSISEDTAGHFVVTGFALSQTTPERALTYALSVTTVGVSAPATVRKGGRFLPAGGQTDTLTSVRIRAGAGEGARVELLALEGRRVVDRHTREFDVADFRSALAWRGERRPRTGTHALALATAEPQAPGMPTADAPAVNLEIDGLIIDETRTKSGRDFYGYFYAAWQPPLGGSGVSITLRERAARGLVSRVDVVIDGAIVYRAVLQPRRTVLEATAQQAAMVTARHVRQREELDQQLVDPDQAGSGLY